MLQHIFFTIHHTGTEFLHFFLWQKKPSLYNSMWQVLLQLWMLNLACPKPSFTFGHWNEEVANIHTRTGWSTNHWTIFLWTVPSDRICSHLKRCHSDWWLDFSSHSRSFLLDRANADLCGLERCNENCSAMRRKMYVSWRRLFRSKP